LSFTTAHTASEPHTAVFLYPVLSAAVPNLHFWPRYMAVRGRRSDPADMTKEMGSILSEYFLKSKGRQR